MSLISRVAPAAGPPGSPGKPRRAGGAGHEESPARAASDRPGAAGVFSPFFGASVLVALRRGCAARGAEGPAAAAGSRSLMRYGGSDVLPLLRCRHVRSRAVGPKRTIAVVEVLAEFARPTAGCSGAGRSARDSRAPRLRRASWRDSQGLHRLSMGNDDRRQAPSALLRPCPVSGSRHRPRESATGSQANARYAISRAPSSAISALSQMPTEVR